MRASRETESVERYSMQAVSAWIGNSQAIAKPHYPMVRDEHFRQATLDPSCGAVQNPVHSLSVMSDQERKRPPRPAPLSPGNAEQSCKARRLSKGQVGPVGLEPTTNRL